MQKRQLSSRQAKCTIGEHVLDTNAGKQQS
jgi:hypothetical protein